MNHLESLTEKLHALLPELLELTRGCKFTYKDEPMVYIGRSRHGFVQAIHSDGFLWDTATQKDPEKLIKEFKILGHEITLEHVMKALGIIGHYYTLNPHVVNDAQTCWIEVKSNADFWIVGLPLHKQSPELHEFLDNLLPEPNEE